MFAGRTYSAVSAERPPGDAFLLVHFLPSCIGMQHRMAAAIVVCALAAGCAGDDAPTAPSPVSDPSVPVATGGAPTDDVRLADDFGGRLLFPPDNWWNQDITTAPVDSQSDAYVDFVGRSRTAHPDFGPPPYGMPYLGVGGAEARRPVAFVEYGGESDDGFRGEGGYPIPELAKSQPNVIEGGVPGGGATGDRHLLIVDRDKWLLYELFAAQMEYGGRTLGSRIGRSVRPVVERTASGGLDVGRRCRSRNPAGSRPIRRIVAWTDPPCSSCDGSTHERLRLAGLTSRRKHAGRAANGCAAPAQGVEKLVRISTSGTEHLSRDADARPDRRRQRKRSVRHRHDGSPLEQRYQSRLPKSFDERLRGHPPRLAVISIKVESIAIVVSRG